MRPDVYSKAEATDQPSILFRLEMRVRLLGCPNAIGYGWRNSMLAFMTNRPSLPSSLLLCEYVEAPKAKNEDNY